MYDTSPGNDDIMASAIQEFYDDLDSIQTADRPPTYKGPSNLANVWAHLFTIHVRRDATS